MDYPSVTNKMDRWIDIDMSFYICGMCWLI